MKDEKTVTIGRKSERMVVNMGKLIDLMVIWSLHFLEQFKKQEKEVLGVDTHVK